MLCCCERWWWCQKSKSKMQILRKGNKPGTLPNPSKFECPSINHKYTSKRLIRSSNCRKSYSVSPSSCSKNLQDSDPLERLASRSQARLIDNYSPSSPRRDCLEPPFDLVAGIAANERNCAWLLIWQIGVSEVDLAFEEGRENQVCAWLRSLEVSAPAGIMALHSTSEGGLSIERKCRGRLANTVSEKMVSEPERKVLLVGDKMSRSVREA